MNILVSEALNAKQRTAIYTLWNNEYPINLSYNAENEFDTYLNKLDKPRHYFLVDDNQEIAGWGFEFERETVKWFAIIINNKHHAKGYGTQLLDKLKQRNKKLHAWVIDHNSAIKLNGDHYISPLAFYLKNDFIIIENSRLEADKISAVKIIWTKES